MNQDLTGSALSKIIALAAECVLKQLAICVASFPGHFCLQFLITCSMQKRRGKAWEKKSRAWRQVDMRVDIHVRGMVPDHCNSQTLHWSASNLPNNELYWRWRTPRFFVGHHPTRLPSRLPDIMDMTLSPRPPPSIFAYCKRSKTGGRDGLGTRLGPGLCSLAWLQICSCYTESKILVAALFQKWYQNQNQSWYLLTHITIILMQSQSCTPIETIVHPLASSHVYSDTHLVLSECILNDLCCM